MEIFKKKVQKLKTKYHKLLKNTTRNDIRHDQE